MYKLFFSFTFSLLKRVSMFGLFFHHQKAEHHSIPKFRLKVNFRHPMKRQNFGDTSGQDPNLHLALCLRDIFEKIWKVYFKRNSSWNFPKSVTRLNRSRQASPLPWESLLRMLSYSASVDRFHWNVRIGSIWFIDRAEIRRIKLWVWPLT